MINSTRGTGGLFKRAIALFFYLYSFGCPDGGTYRAIGLFNMLNMNDAQGRGVAAFHPLQIAQVRLDLHHFAARFQDFYP